MVRTRRQPEIEESVQGDCLLSETDANSMDDWDIPSMNGKLLKATMINTYSKSRPQKRMNIITRSDFGPAIPKPPSKTPTKTHNETEKTVSIEKNRNYPQCPDSGKSAQKVSGKRKHPTSNFSECSRKKRFSMLTSGKKPNKTTVSIGSMVAGTMMELYDDSGTNVPMSLCSMVDNHIHNSTVDMALNYCNVETIADYVPEDISVIQGDKEPNYLCSSFCNEITPLQPIKTGVDITRKVQFSACRTGQTSKVSKTNDKPTARRSILKTPYKKSPKPCSPQRKTGTSSANLKNKLAQSQPDTMVYNSYQSKDSDDQTNPTGVEKLLEFEPLPLQCSDDNLTGNSIIHRDITPETLNSASKLSTSGKGSRRLLYPPHGKDPACFLLDLSVNERKNAAIFFGEYEFQLSIEDANVLPTDSLH